MKYMHENSIIHRDLKMTNILINTKKHVRICDFGIAKQIDLTTLTSLTPLTQGVGTLAFMAPELLEGNTKYNEKVDVYSFGVVMFFIVTKGKMPEFKITGYGAVVFLNTVNNLSQKIIRSCWSIDPDQRPSFSQIIQMIIDNNFLLINGIESKISQLKTHLEI